MNHSFFVLIYLQGSEEKMSKKLFTKEEIKQLQKNPYIKNVSEKAITYTKEFKELFLCELNKGKATTEIFRNAGFDTKLIGRQRMDNFSKRVKKNGIEDTRKGNSGRARKHDKELTLEEELKQMKHKNALLEQENEFLKKMIFLGKEKSWMKYLQEKGTK